MQTDHFHVFLYDITDINGLFIGTDKTLSFQQHLHAFSSFLFLTSTVRQTAIGFIIYHWNIYMYTYSYGLKEANQYRLNLETFRFRVCLHWAVITQIGLSCNRLRADDMFDNRQKISFVHRFILMIVTNVHRCLGLWVILL